MRVEFFPNGSRQIWMFFFIVVTPLFSFTQTPYRLHVQPGNSELIGDGEDHTAITVTARDEFGEIVKIDGTVILELNAGWLEESSIKMRSGIAETLLKAPILDNESLVFKRSMQLTMNILQSVKGMTAEEATAPGGKAQMLKKMMMAARESPNASSLTTIKGSDPRVKIIASMNGFQGKAEIKILEGSTETAGLLKSGVYEGKDVTGQSTWEMAIETNGSGFKGTITTQGAPMSIMSEGDTKAGFLIIYLYDEKELKLLQKSDFATDFKGFPTAMKILPGNTVYMVAPPVYMTWKRANATRQTGTTQNEPPEEEVSKVSLIPKRNMLPGDGITKTELAFIYRNKKGQPVAGKSVSFSMMRGGMGGKLLQTSGTTDSKGLVRITYQAPEFKTDKLQKLGTCKKEMVYADYKEDNENERVWAEIGILCCTDSELVITKPGFKEDFRQKVILESPRGEFSGKLVQKLVNKLSPERPELVPIVNAECRLQGGAIEEIKDSLKIKTDKKGEFKIILPMKNWPFYRKMEIETKGFQFSELHEHRRDGITKEMYQFPDMEFRHRFSAKIYNLEKAMCLEEEKVAEAQENKLQILADLNVITWMTDKLIADTAGEVISNGWGLIGALFSYANGKWQFTKIIDDKLKDANNTLNQFIKIEGSPGKDGLKRILYAKLRTIFDSKSVIGRNTVILLNEANSKIFGELTKVLTSLVTKLSTLQKWPENPVPEILKDELKFSYRGDVEKKLEIIMNADAMVLNNSYVWLQPWLTSHSGDLRAHYLNISSWRLAAEEAKAWKDLVVDLSISIAIVSAACGNVTAMQTWNKLKKFSEKLDNALLATGFVLEIVNVAQLRAECLALFDKVIGQSGRVNTTACGTRIDGPGSAELYATAYRSSISLPNEVSGLETGWSWKKGLSSLGFLSVESSKKQSEFESGSMRHLQPITCSLANLGWAAFPALHPLLVVGSVPLGFLNLNIFLINWSYKQKPPVMNLRLEPVFWNMNAMDSPGEPRTPPSLKNLDIESLMAPTMQLPMSTFIQFLNWFTEWKKWELENSSTLFFAIATDESQVIELNATLEEIEERVLQLKLIAMTSGNQFSSEQEHQDWNNQVKGLSSLIEKLATTSQKVNQKGLEVEGNSKHIEIEDISLPTIHANPFPFKVDKMEMMVLSALAIILAGSLVAILVILRRRKRRSIAPKQNMPDSYTPAPPAQQGDRIVLADGRTFLLNQPVIKIGASPDNQIYLPSSGLQLYHAQISYSEEHRNWWIAVQNPNCFLAMNGMSGPSFWLTHGAQVTVGGMNLYFYR